MKNIINKLTVLIMTLVLGTAAFANTTNLLAKNEFQTRQSAIKNTYRTNDIPQAMFDTNFRQWQPDRPVPLIAANINDIMMTDGSKIYYNPAVVNRTPPKVVVFFLAHEYGHIYGRTSNEYLADQFAARVYAQTDIAVVKAAVWHFYNIQGNMCDQAHGCGWQRAQNIAQTAGFSREEYENIIRGKF